MARAIRRAGTAVVAVMALGTTGTAAASWISTGAGSGATRADSLATPSGVTATCVSATTNAVSVSWTGGTPPLVVSFDVQRRSNTGPTWTTIANVLASLPRTHTDAALPEGTYTYRVAARNGNWAVASADTTSRTFKSNGRCS